MGRRRVKNYKNIAYTFDVAPRNIHAKSREKRRHPDQYGEYIRVSKEGQETALNESEKLPEV